MPSTNTYTVKREARGLAAQVLDNERTRFFVGTTSTHKQNSIHVVELNEDQDDVSCFAVLEHTNEVWHISPSPSDASLFFTTHLHGDIFASTLWQMPDDDATETIVEDSHGLSMKSVVVIPTSSRRVSGVLWAPSKETGKVICVEDRSLGIWAIDAANASVKESGKIWCGGKTETSKGCWDPHHPNTFLTAGGNSMKFWDLRTTKETGTIRDAHHRLVLDMDFNPNRPNIFVSSGDDCAFKFWDSRKPDTAVKVVTGHSHWVTSVRYNRFHDQLLLSASSDNTVSLWNVPSLSANPVDGSESREKAEDTLVMQYKDHEESVSDVVWSACDGWVFASLSYDGRLFVQKVPPTEKYKILCE
eukprot:c4816_g1_i1.p1 GENE.c4816_g1_i1~~c4816_g1_i1.p1  ORF type:complete len:359 (+),score=84.98 c4816_g1_i1:35-1111(+)